MTTLIRAPRLDEALHVLGRMAFDVDGPDAAHGLRTGSDPIAHADIEVQADARNRSASTQDVDNRIAEASDRPDTDIAKGDAVAATVAMPTVEELKTIFADQIAEWRHAAMELGQNEGREIGQREVEQRHAERLHQVDQTIAGLQSALDQSIDGLIDVGVDIVYEAVTRILGHALLDKAGTAAVVREVIRTAKDRSRLLIRVNPSDHAVLLSMQDQLIEGLSTQHTEIVADDRVELGGCLLETPAGNLDGRLEVQLQQLRDTLVSARLRRPESVLES